MISTAPMPAWKDLLAFGAGNADALALAQPWNAGGAGALWFSRGASAIEAIQRWQKNTQGPGRFWLPDYFCNQSMAPARAAGADLVFYPVGEDLKPRWDALERMAATAPPALFMLVHYFGSAQEVEAALGFCRRHGARLVEDAAHALKPADGIGASGDFVLYSPSKVLPVPDGAVLVVRDSQAFTAMTKDSSAETWPSSLAWIGKRMVQKILPAAAEALRSGRGQRFGEDAAPRALASARAISPTARRILTRLAPELPAIAEARRANARSLAALWANVSEACPLFTDSMAAPYRFVLRFQSEEAATRAYDRLKRTGCPAESWPDLPPEVLADPAGHADAIRLRKTLLFLPVHQSIGRAEISCCGP